MGTEEILGIMFIFAFWALGSGLVAFTKVGDNVEFVKKSKSGLKIVFYVCLAVIFLLGCFLAYGARSGVQNHISSKYLHL